MNRAFLFVLCLGITLLYSCKDDHDHDGDDDLKADLPELSVDTVSMLGPFVLNDALMFSIDDVPFIGLGRMPFVGKNSDFYYYKPEDRTWEKVTSEYPGGSREGAVAFVIGQKAYVGLGCTVDKNPNPFRRLHDDFFVYDNETGIWELLSFKFPGGARWGAVAFSIGGKGYVGTGYTENAQRMADFYEFDPVTGWKRVPNIGYARAGSSVFVADGCGYVCFGDGANGIQKFDPKTNSWKSQPIDYDEDEEEKFNPVLVRSFVINKNGEDFVYLWGNGCWGYNPRKNLWKKMKYPMWGEYGFTMGGRGYSMGVNEGEGGFYAKVFEVVK